MFQEHIKCQKGEGLTVEKRDEEEAAGQGDGFGQVGKKRKQDLVFNTSERGAVPPSNIPTKEGVGKEAHTLLGNDQNRGQQLWNTEGKKWISKVQCDFLPGITST